VIFKYEKIKALGSLKDYLKLFCVIIFYFVLANVKINHNIYDKYLIYVKSYRKNKEKQQSKYYSFSNSLWKNI
jgi:hypothetical protein